MAGSTNLLPSQSQLLKSTCVAVTLATLALILVILPAEYGIDPFGSGKFIGLTALNEDTSPDIIPVNDVSELSPSEPLIVFGMAMKSESKTITLDAYDGIEMKLRMQTGDHIVFHWHANGDKVYSDMHGEKFEAEDDFRTYWKEKQQADASGAFTAPFSGTHGWYWQNMGEEAVTIELTVSGKYHSLDEKK